MTDSDPVLLAGSFNPKLKTYLLIQFSWIAVITIVGIPLLILIPVAMIIINRYFNSLSCEMTEKFLKVRKGILVKIEKNVPLEQITDLGIVEGPLMRHLGIKALSVETAGQSSQGPLVRLIGLNDPEPFRDDVLRQRDKLRKTIQTDGRTESGELGDAGISSEILATLKRIEELLRETRNS